MTEHVGRVVSALPGWCRMFYAMKANSAEPLPDVVLGVSSGLTQQEYDTLS